MEPFFWYVASIVIIFLSIVATLYTIGIRSTKNYQIAIIVGILYPLVIISLIGYTCMISLIWFKDKLVR